PRQEVPSVMLDTTKAPAATAERHDLYGVIHRGLRKAEMEFLARLGALDADDDLAVAGMAAELRRLLILGRYHLVDENEHIHTALESRKPGAARGLDEDHAEHEESFRELERMIERIESAIPAHRKAMLR